jgi:GTP-binding protein LepA
VDRLTAGRVGYLMANIKSVRDVRVGDTVVEAGAKDVKALPGYKEPLPVVFCGFYPTGDTNYEELKKALERLSLNDSSFKFAPETSEALGFGFRCGFLGLLHMEIVRERLEREYDLELLATTPNVRYDVRLTSGETVEVHSPTELPDPGAIETIEEPYIRATVICPAEHVGAVMELCQARRGTHVDMHYLSPQRVQIRYDLPLAEIVLDFFDYLKSSTRGYASLDYEPIGNRPSDLVKVDILLAGDRVDALSIIVHRDFAYEQGKRLVERLRKTIPRQLFDVPVQAAVGSRILARETVKALRKDVTAKLYGGDVTRKQKLLKKQKAGKKRMKQVGRVEVPQEAFLAVLEIDE